MLDHYSLISASLHTIRTNWDWSASLFLTIDLSLPDRVGHAPEGGQQKEGPALVRVGHPCEEVGNDTGIDGGAQDEDRQAAQVLDKDPQSQRSRPCRRCHKQSERSQHSRLREIQILDGGSPYGQNWQREGVPKWFQLHLISCIWDIVFFCLGTVPYFFQNFA